ncbi:MAG: diguanylate cyclase domain-containing protein [Alcanivorax sediminis]|uniref:sensor domain-containing diguanylate cyclase n=1 Tax=Alcanivorax sediminis TaxID=2663008 RepID=UPI003C610AE2
MDDLRDFSVTSMRTLHQLSLLDRTDLSALFQAYLDSGCELLGLSTGIVSQIEQDRYTVSAVSGGGDLIKQGDVFPLGDTYCQAVVTKRGTVALHHVGALEEMRTHPVYQGMQLESYIGTPLRVGDNIVGTLNFSATGVRAEPFTVEELEFIELMAQSLSHALEQDQLRHSQAQSHSAREASEALFEAAFQHAAIPMAIVAPDGHWLRVNDAVCDLLGYSSQELLAMDFQTITHPDDLHTDLAHVQSLLCGDKNQYWMQKRYFHRNGELVWALLAASIVRNADGSPRCFLSQIKDISAQRDAESALLENRDELEQLNQELAQLARIDSLTGLSNRTVMMEHLRHAHGSSLRSGEPLACLLMEVDGFRGINETFGHSEGDALLVAVADCLKSVIGKRGEVGRYSADVFMAVLPESGINSALQMADRCLQGVAGLDGVPQPLSLSIGVAALMPDEEPPQPDMDDLLRTADQALYATRETGGNGVRALRVETVVVTA